MITLETLAPVAATGMFIVRVADDRRAGRRRRAPAAAPAASWTGPATGSPSPPSLFSFSVAVCLFAQQLLSRRRSTARSSVPLFTWITIGAWEVSAGLLVDQLSILFALLITGVGGLIHLYSVGYMAHDERRRRFFAYLNLFIAAMLILVLADNYLVLFVGWEGVGLASYLLIGFWQHKPSAAAAAQEGVRDEPGRRPRHDDGRDEHAGAVRQFGLRRRSTHAHRSSTRSGRPRSACCCCWAPAASPPRCRCRPGCWTRWRARPRCRP